MLGPWETVATELSAALGQQKLGSCPHCGGEHVVKKAKDAASGPRQHEAWPMGRLILWPAVRGTSQKGRALCIGQRRGEPDIQMARPSMSCDSNTSAHR